MGCGNIGSIAAEDLATSMGSTEVVVADVDEARAKIVAQKIGASNVSWILSDVMKQNELLNTLKEFDLVMGFLPAHLAYRLAETCIIAQESCRCFLHVRRSSPTQRRRCTRWFNLGPRLRAGAWNQQRVSRKFSFNTRQNQIGSHNGGRTPRKTHSTFGLRSHMVSREPHRRVHTKSVDSQKRPNDCC